MKDLLHLYSPATDTRVLTQKVGMDKLRRYREEIAVARNSVHVLRHPKGGWAVKKRDSSRASKTFDTQQEAISWGKKASKNDSAEFVIHRPDGTIKSRDTFAKDPAPPRDRPSKD